MEITSKVMLVTPEMATKWLANTIGNRHINKERVKTYVNDIKNGWALNGQPIIISDKNHLMDGHHRLTAIVEAKTPARFVVTYGVKEETMATIDIGMRRSNSNVFAIAGIKNYAPISSIVNRFFTMNQTDGVFMNHGFKETPQNLLDNITETRNFINWHRELVVGAKKHVCLQPHLPELYLRGWFKQAGGMPKKWKTF